MPSSPFGRNRNAHYQQSPGRLWQTSEAVNHRLLLLEGTLTMGKDGMNERLFDFMTPDPYTRRFAHFLHLYIAVDA